MAFNDVKNVHCLLSLPNETHEHTVYTTWKLLSVLQKQQLGCVLEEEPQDKHFSEELMAPEDEPLLPHFQRSMSLPRGFGKREQLGYQQQQQAVLPLPSVRVPSPRSDSVTVLRNLLINRHRVQVSEWLLHSRWR